MKAYIHPHVIGAIRDKLENLLREIGCEVVDDPENCDVELDSTDASAEEGPDSEEADNQAPPPCLVVLTPGVVEDDLQPGLKHAASRGCRVIGIWGPGSDGDMSALADYGADTVTWNSGHIRDAICGKPQHQAPDGKPARRPAPTTGGC